MMATIRKGSSAQAYRYFLFILSLCIVLFVFLMTRLAGSIHTEIDYEGMIVPAFRAVQWSPPDDSVHSSGDLRDASLTM